MKKKDGSIPKGFVRNTLNDNPNEEYPVAFNVRNIDSGPMSLESNQGSKPYPVKISKTLSQGKGVLVRIKEYKDAP